MDLFILNSLNLSIWNSWHLLILTFIMRTSNTCQMVKWVKWSHYWAEFDATYVEYEKLYLPPRGSWKIQDHLITSNGALSFSSKNGHQKKRNLQATRIMGSFTFVHWEGLWVYSTESLPCLNNLQVEQNVSL